LSFFQKKFQRFFKCETDTPFGNGSIPFFWRLPLNFRSLGKFFSGPDEDFPNTGMNHALIRLANDVLYRFLIDQTVSLK